MNFLFFFRGSNRSIVHSHQTFLEGVKRHPCIRIPYCWWKKSGWPVEVGSWSHYFQGFKNIQKVVGLGISEPSTVFTFYMKRNIVKDSCWILLMLQKSINKLRITSLYIYIPYHPCMVYFPTFANYGRMSLSSPKILGLFPGETAKCCTCTQSGGFSALPGDLEKAVNLFEKSAVPISHGWKMKLPFVWAKKGLFTSGKLAEFLFQGG